MFEMELFAKVLTVSDGVAHGVRENLSGAALTDHYGRLVGR